MYSCDKELMRNVSVMSSGCGNGTVEQNRQQPAAMLVRCGMACAAAQEKPQLTTQQRSLLGGVADAAAALNS
jgi:hypothetical protein